MSNNQAKNNQLCGVVVDGEPVHDFAFRVDDGDTRQLDADRIYARDLPAITVGFKRYACERYSEQVPTHRREAVTSIGTNPRS